MGKNGIIQEDEGYFILVDGIQRTFRDVKPNAFAAARYLKEKNKTSIIEIEDRSTGQKFVMLGDGRTS